MENTEILKYLHAKDKADLYIFSMFFVLLLYYKK